MKASNIEWDIDMDEVYEKFDEVTYEKAAKELGIPAERYANMHTNERHDLIYDTYHHSPGQLYDFLGLPDEVEIPAEIGTDEEDIANWLSDEYGYCHEGFSLDTD